jgi:glucosamine--fructose-6-phosphate aminotransferase (isomerizing)
MATLQKPVASPWCTTASPKVHEELRRALQAKVMFSSQTDTEVIVHLVDSLYDGDVFEALRLRCSNCVAHTPLLPLGRSRTRSARRSPLILGRKDHSENFLASDAMALAGVTDQIVYPKKAIWWTCSWASTGSLAKTAKFAQRPVKTVLAHSGAAELGPTATTCKRSSSSRAPLPTRSKASPASCPRVW